MSLKKTALSKSSPRKPVQVRGIRTREKIIEAGEKLFIQKGFHNVLADDVAREAGVSVGSFYGYFEDKRALFLAILDQASLGMLGNATEQLSSLWAEEQIDVEDLLRKTMHMLIDAHRLFFPLYQEAQEMAVFDESIRNYIQESDRSTREIFEKMIFRLNPNLEKTRLHSAAHVIYHASEGVIHNLVTNREPEINEDEIVQELSILFNGYLKILRSI